MVMDVNSELLQRVWFLLLGSVTVGPGVSVTEHCAVAVPQLELAVVMVMVPASVGVPVISLVSGL